MNTILELTADQLSCPIDRQTAEAARLLEHASRLAEDQAKLSAHVGALTDVIREAQVWAERAGAAQIGATHVQQAFDANGGSGVKPSRTPNGRYGSARVTIATASVERHSSRPGLLR